MEIQNSGLQNGDSGYTRQDGYTTLQRVTTAYAISSSIYASAYEPRPYFCVDVFTYLCIYVRELYAGLRDLYVREHSPSESRLRTTSPSIPIANESTHAEIQLWTLDGAMGAICIRDEGRRVGGSEVSRYLEYGATECLGRDGRSGTRWNGTIALARTMVEWGYIPPIFTKGLRKHLREGLRVTRVGGTHRYQV